MLRRQLFAAVATIADEQQPAKFGAGSEPDAYGTACTVMPVHPDTDRRDRTDTRPPQGGLPSPALRPLRLAAAANDGQHSTEVRGGGSRSIRSRDGTTGIDVGAGEDVARADRAASMQQSIGCSCDGATGHCDAHSALNESLDSKCEFGAARLLPDDTARWTERRAERPGRPVLSTREVTPKLCPDGGLLPNLL